MTEKQLHSLLNVWVKRLGLSQWKISLVFGPCEDYLSYMEVERSVDYQRARITVSPWLLGAELVPKEILLKLTDDIIEESLVHELLHICTGDLTSIVRRDIIGLVHRDVHRVLEDSMTRADERCVDSLAVALCKAFRKEMK